MYVMCICVCIYVCKYVLLLRSTYCACCTYFGYFFVYVYVCMCTYVCIMSMQHMRVPFFDMMFILLILLGVLSRVGIVLCTNTYLF